MDLVWLWLALPLAALHVEAIGSTREWTQDIDEDSCPNTDVEAGYVANTALINMHIRHVLILLSVKAQPCIYT